MENENQELIVKEEESNVMDLNSFRKKSSSEVGTFSNIQDSKELFNLSNNVDFKLNDVVGEKIRFNKVLIRRYEKKLEEPIVNEETGEVIESEIKISCVIVSVDGKSYATGSKMFTYKLLNYLVDCGGASDLAKEGVEIEIVKNPTPNGNKSLGFKVL